MATDMAHGADASVAHGAQYLFPQGLYGFETQRRFVLLRDEENPQNPFMWLKSEEEAGVAFPVLDAATLFSDYAPALPELAAQALELGEGGAPRFLVIASVLPEDGRLFLNLKCPVALNPARRLGTQMILEDERFPMRYYLPRKQEG